MVQHVSSPTHELGRHLLDALTTAEGPAKDFKVEEVKLSDHMLIICSFDMSLLLPEYIRISRRSWKDFYIDNFKCELQDSELCYRIAAVTEGEESIDTCGKV